MATLRAYAFPGIGRKRVDHISPADVMGVLLPIWNEKHQTAKRVRQRIGTVMRWAIAQGYRVDNPAGDAIGAALPRPPRVQKHYKALPYGEVAGAIEAVLGSEARVTVKLGFEFLVLTACRSGEVRGACWAEIDLGGGVWTIPAERMKSRREHRVPLSARAREILAGAKAHAPRSELVFPSARGLVLPSFEFAGLLKALGIGAVPHGLRSSFGTGRRSGQTRPRAVMEAALAHAVRNRVEAAYARSDLFRTPPRPDGRLGGLSGGPESGHRRLIRPFGCRPLAVTGSEAVSGHSKGISGKIRAIGSPRIDDLGSPRGTVRVGRGHAGESRRHSRRP